MISGVSRSRTAQSGGWARLIEMTIELRVTVWGESIVLQNGEPIATIPTNPIQSLGECARSDHVVPRFYRPQFRNLHLIEREALLFSTAQHP